MRYSSPLRYPGGKGRLANYIGLLFSVNQLIDGQYVEPYAGGAGIAFYLLFNEYIQDIHLNDIDESIYAFWHSVIFETEELCQRIRDKPVSIAEWRKQKHIRENSKDFDLLDLGFSTFFLNRTNRSGIITGGVIGGIEQIGKWKIDARYNKENLIERIKRIARYKSRIHLYNENAYDFLKDVSPALTNRVLIYLDPPYYNKGQELYENHYQHEDHVLIAQLVAENIDKNWIITYDNLPVIQELYSKFRHLTYNISYSASKRYKGSEIMIFCDNLTLPEVDSPACISSKHLKRLLAGQRQICLPI